ncbi:hypothetical protein ACPUVO_05790 [Pseudocolwellia sp. HL-MZ19]|uniref:hypothetical protein n=1 Tax=unclassified Pseudocolwellia TaxID=2848178 RepID=UPI003CEDDDA4
MKYRLDYVTFNILPNNIIETIIDEGVTLTLEMSEEIRKTLAPVKTKDFACLFNNINDYKLSFETQFNMISEDNLIALAFVYYTEESRLQAEKLVKLRAVDNWNVKMFSGLEMGWQEAHDWLTSEVNRSQTIAPAPRQPQTITEQ